MPAQPGRRDATDVDARLARSLARPTRRARRIAGPAAITAAVLDVGFEGLTVSAVAGALGVTHSSLYKHVGGREDLVRLAAQQLLAALPPASAGGGWRAMLRRESWLYWDLVEAHPGLALEVAVQSSPPPAATARWDHLQALLLESGFAADGAELAADLVCDLPLDVAIRAHHLARADSLPAHGPGAREWFARKLEVVLAGIAVEVAPPNR